MNLEPVRPVLDAALAECEVPGAVVAVARGEEPPSVLAAGTDSSGRPLGADSLFPVASITKLATALCVLRLADAGALSLDDPLASHLPEAAAARHGVTIRALLTHTSGLPYDLRDGAAPPFEHRTWEDFVHAWLATPLEAEPATRVCYSNVGYALLALVVERVSAQPIADAIASLVSEPLGIEAYLGTEPPRAPATVVDPPARGTETDWWNTAYWRSFPLPYDGLVTTAAGALELVRAFAGRREATRDRTGRLSGALGNRPWGPLPWGLGPQIAPPGGGPHSFGHSGLTGCAVWNDPDADLSVAILGTRVGFEWLDRGVPRIAAAIS